MDKEHERESVCKFMTKMEENMPNLRTMGQTQLNKWLQYPDAFISELADLRSGDTELFAVRDHAHGHVPIPLTIDQHRN